MSRIFLISFVSLALMSSQSAQALSCSYKADDLFNYYKTGNASGVLTTAKGIRYRCVTPKQDSEDADTAAQCVEWSAFKKGKKAPVEYVVVLDGTGDEFTVFTPGEEALVVCTGKTK
jgi:hypothetical protein